MAAAKKPELYLMGPQTDGVPSFEQLMSLFERLTGEQAHADAADYADAKRTYDAEVARRQKERRGT